MHSSLMRSTFGSTVAVLALLVFRPPADAQPQPALGTDSQSIRQFDGQTMGTTYMVKVVGGESVDDETIRLSVDAELRAVNDEMSTYLPSSLLSKFNQSKSTDWIDVNANVVDVVRYAQQVSKATDGAFDVTVGPLVNAWHFGPDEKTNQIPSDEAIATLLQQVGYEKLSYREDPPALKKSVAELQVDLSSIAKGHGVDRVVDRLAGLGLENVFVEIGGEVRTSGSKPDKPWAVGIQMPDAASNTVLIAHAMKPESSQTSMATSGDYRIFYVVDGKRYSHTIDPRTGRPVEHSMASVTVVAENCMAADAWATAINVVGPDQAIQLAQTNELGVLTVWREGDDYLSAGTGTLAQYAKEVEPSAAGVANADEGQSFLSQMIPVAILTVCVVAILLLGMSVGVLFGRRAISGSCGGLASKTNPDGSSSCSLCSSPSDACKELRDKMAEKQNAS
ncbi:Thiamine biosynthesis lipoprotein ApbE precursor [Stieleria bergensis]|uniref:FAD:protein FMN transferase n=1 Tax=Stieleria bergensis TaxID=2528025 RepID=A0A517SVZ7_9BACT|nr:Thiamine biosynthesis lipoprotein ApbE precursor [Planctomycetes bacterium SV_7m_r]